MERADGSAVTLISPGGQWARLRLIVVCAFALTHACISIQGDGGANAGACRDFSGDWTFSGSCSVQSCRVTQDGCQVEMDCDGLEAETQLSGNQLLFSKEEGTSCSLSASSDSSGRASGGCKAPAEVCSFTATCTSGGCGKPMENSPTVGEDSADASVAGIPNGSSGGSGNSGSSNTIPSSNDAPSGTAGSGGIAIAPTGGTFNGGDGDGDIAGGGDVGGCDPMDPTGTDDECPALTECGESLCQAEYQACLGANYQEGDFFGGVCEAYFECSSQCDCDQACIDACDFSQCETCFTGSNLSNCIAANCLDEAVACQNDGSGSGGAGGAAGIGVGGAGGVGGGAGWVQDPLIHEQCQTLCEGLVNRCPSFNYYNNDAAECRAECEANSALWNMSCRLNHLAALPTDDDTTHCPHINGAAPCTPVVFTLP